MADIPVLLKGPLVRQFLADRKTVTRRLDLAKWRRAKPGHRIWFKETWRPFPCDPELWNIDVAYQATPDEERARFADGDIGGDWTFPKAANRGWVPSIFMPKWACRCWAVIEDIREEPLQDITEEDARSEGVRPGECTDGTLSYMHGFADIWDSIYSKPGQRWADNPTVAVVTFRRIEKP